MKDGAQEYKVLLHFLCISQDMREVGRLSDGVHFLPPQVSCIPLYDSILSNAYKSMLAPLFHFLPLFFLVHEIAHFKYEKRAFDRPLQDNNYSKKKRASQKQKKMLIDFLHFHHQSYCFSPPQPPNQKPLHHSGEDSRRCEEEGEQRKA